MTGPPSKEPPMNLSSSPLLRRLTRLRDALVPEALGLGWMPPFILG